jgi:hypothetical protein
VACDGAITAGICRRWNGLNGQFAPQKSWIADVADGSKGDISAALIHVCFTPESRHRLAGF